MKIKWGICNVDAGRIWLNLELAKKPLSCLEYVVVLEMTHLLKYTHTDQFRALLDQFIPNWRAVLEELNEFVLQWGSRSDGAAPLGREPHCRPCFIGWFNRYTLYVD